jgi:hypothetical protein
MKFKQVRLVVAVGLCLATTIMLIRLVDGGDVDKKSVGNDYFPLSVFAGACCATESLSKAAGILVTT